jgi:hypothetical protein
MPDEATAALEETQDTSVEAASPEETPATESTDSQTAPATPDHEKRYNDLRSEFDRRNAALSGQYGPEAQADALRQFGIELEAEEEEAPEDDYADPGETALKRTEALEQRLAEREQQAEAAEFDRLEDQYITKTIKDLEGEHSVTLTDKEKRIVRNDALANRLQDDRPDLEGAIETLIEVKKAERNAVVNGKKDAPMAPVGTAGEDKLDLSDDETRQKYMAEVFESEGGFADN